MKVANNMDSVFSNCTEDELDFEAFFDHDDCLIDVVAGVDEAGNLITGEDFNFDEIYAQMEAEDIAATMVGDNPDFDYQKDGDAAYSLKDAEGTKDVKPEVGGEVGDDKSLANKDSAESKAHDVTKDIDDAIGASDKKQVSLEGEGCGQCEGSDCEPEAAKDPLAEDDEKERVGEEVPVGSVATESAPECPTDGGTKKPKSIYMEEFDAALDSFLENVDINNYNEAKETVANVMALDEGLKEFITNVVSKNRKVNNAIKNGQNPTAPAMDAAKKAFNDEAAKKDTKGVVAKAGAAAALIAAAATAGIAIAKKNKNNKSEEEAKNESVDQLADKILESILGSEVVNEEESPIDDGKCPNDSDKRAGEGTDAKNVEGRDSDTIAAADNGKNTSDVIEDKDDEDARAGKAPIDNQNVEGVKSKVVESFEEELDIEIEEEYDIEIEDDELVSEADGDLDKDIDKASDGKGDIQSVDPNVAVVPDTVQKSDSSNNIPMGSDAERAKESGIDENADEEIDVDEATLFEMIKSVFEETEVEKAAKEPTDDEDEALANLAVDVDNEDVGDIDLDYDADDEDLIDLVSSGKAGIDID